MVWVILAAVAIVDYLHSVIYRRPRLSRSAYPATSCDDRAKIRESGVGACVIFVQNARCVGVGLRVYEMWMENARWSRRMRDMTVGCEIRLYDARCNCGMRDQEMRDTAGKCEKSRNPRASCRRRGSTLLCVAYVHRHLAEPHRSSGFWTVVLDGRVLVGFW